MKITSHVLCGVAVAAALLMGCSSTQVTNSWTDPAAATKSFKKVLVVGVFKDDSVRRSMESKLAEELRKSNVAAVPSSSIIQDVKMDKETVRDVVSRNDFDSVLVADYLGTKKSLEYVPGMYDEYIGWAGPLVMDTGYMEQRTEAKVQSKLYDVKGGGRVVWSASTSTLDPGSAKDAIPGIASKLVEQLTRDVRI